MSRGRLISFEGLDGSGKTTQMLLLEQWLQRQGIAYVRTREPGGTPLGLEIRSLLFHRPNITITPLAEAFLFQADRAQHFTTLVLPKLEEGIHVLTDRCFDSSIAYQGAARGVGTALVEHLSLIATQGHVPDLTILLDLDPTLVQERTDISQERNGQREQQSRFDSETIAFHQTLREAFLTLARNHPERIKVIDAAQPSEWIHQRIVAFVESLLKSGQQ